MRSASPWADGQPAVDDTSATPRVGEVVSEIGLMLAIHLAVAFAVVLTLGACGIG
jgi:hypothetical protein